MALMDRADKRRLTLLVAPIVALVICSYVGTALAPKLVTEHPVWLLVLDSRNRHLLLTVGAGVDPLPYFLVAFLRLIASDPLFYFLGRYYGDAALRWAERNMGSQGRYVATIERFFGKAAYPLVAIMPNNIMCTMAGTTRMRPAVFIALNFGGTVARLLLFWWLGHAFEEPIKDVLDFIERFQTPLLVLSIGIVVYSVLSSYRRGSSDIQSVRELQAEVTATSEVTTEVTTEVTGEGETNSDDPE